MTNTSEAARALANPSSFESGPPHALFDQLRLEGPVTWIPSTWGTLSDGYWGVVSHPEVLEVSRDNHRFISEMGAAYPLLNRPDPAIPGMMQVDPDHHARIRSMAGRSFSPRVVARFDGWIRGVVRECLERVQATGEVDLVSEVAAIVPGKVIAEVMGAPVADHPAIINWGKDVFGREDPNGGFERSRAAIQSLVGYSFGLREEKRARPGVDVITELADASYEGVAITDGEFGAFIMLLLVAGFETTHTLIGQTLRLLLEHEDIASIANEAMAAGKVHQVNEEFLRFITPAMNMARHAACDLELGGQTIQKNQMIVMWYSAANRDPNVFADPHRFDPDRKAQNHVAFGGQGSPHYCLGHALGRMEGRIFLEEYFASGIRLESAGPAKLTGSALINQLHSLPARVLQ